MNDIVMYIYICGLIEHVCMCSIHVAREKCASSSHISEYLTIFYVVLAVYNSYWK